MSLKGVLSEVTPFLFRTRTFHPLSNLFRREIPYLRRIPPSRSIAANSLHTTRLVLHTDPPEPFIPQTRNFPLNELIRDVEYALPLRVVKGIEASLKPAMDDPNFTLSSLTSDEEERFTAVVRQVFHVLGLIAGRNSLSLADRILDIMHNRWAFPIDATIHDAILSGILLRGESGYLTALGWLQSMSSKPGHCCPTFEQWHNFLRNLESYGRVKPIQSSIEVMKKTGCDPEIDTYTILLRAYFHPDRGIPPLTLLNSVIDQMTLNGVAITREFVDLISEAYKSRGAVLLSIRAAKLMPGLTGYDSNEKDIECGELLLKLPRDTTYTQVMSVLAGYRKQGVKPTVRTLGVVSKRLRDENSLKRWERWLQVDANSLVYAKIIGNAAVARDINRAVELYNSAVERTLPVHPAMIHPILRVMCSTKFHPPADQSIDDALALFDDYLQVSSQQLESSPSGDLPLYNTLLRALAASKNYAKYASVAVDLAEQMQKRNIGMDSMTATGLIILLMKSALTVQEAYAFYKHVNVKEPGKFLLDTKGFTAVLDAFCKLELLRQDPPTSVRCYFDILKDMRLTGEQVPVQVYTILLRELSRLATRLDPREVETHTLLADVIRRTHDVITLDGSLVPDVILWNGLMDAYQRAQCYQDAFEVWEMLYISRQFDNASISIIMDAASYAGRVDVVLDIYTKLRSIDFKFNDKNWINWLECLCRLGKLEDAVKVFCLEMSKEVEDPQVLNKGAGLLLRFSTRTNQEAEIHARIREYVPGIL